jgi:hypothetical protein
MRTAKCVILPVVVTLAGVVALAAAAGQDNPSTPSPAPQRELSGTRTASCVVRIALDPAVMTLSESTVSGLVYSSAVAGQAAREVLHKDLLDQAEGFIQIEWLDMSDASSAPAGRPTNEGYDEQMMRELQQIYGQPYATLFMQQRENADKTGDNREEQPVPKNPKDRRGTSEPPRSSGVQNPYGEMYGMRPGYGRMMRPQVPTDAGQAATIRLSVFMARNDTPAAKELLRAVISNLRSSLRYAYESYLSDLDDQLQAVQRQHAAAVETLEGGTEPAAARVMEQLRRNVDLSALNPEMRLKEAIEYLRRSVEPPLQIVVLWNVLEPTEVYPIQPIGIEALPNVRLGTALDVLLKNIVSKGPQVVYKIEGDVIVIGPESSLQQAPASREPMQVETDARTLAAQRSELARRVQNLYLDLASLEARRDTIEKLVLEIRVKADRQVAEDTVMQEMRKLVDLHTKRLADLQAAAAAGRVAQGELAQPQEDLTRAKIELARRREELSKSAGGSQLDELNGELSRMTIDKAEKEMQRKILLAQLQEVQQQLARASAFDPEAAQRRIAQEALDLAAGRMAELQRRITNLQPPTVTVLGAN